MAKGFDVIRAKSAVKSHKKMDLSRTHLTTLNFGQIMPLMAEEIVPGDKYNVKAFYFSRLAPLVKPTYGKFSFRTMSAFVPYHQVADNIEGWLAGSQTWHGKTASGRYIKMNTLALFFSYISTEVYPTIPADSSIPSNAVLDDITDGYINLHDASDSTIKYKLSFDWTYVDANGVAKYVVFKGVNAYYVKVLNALGYALPQRPDLQSTSSWYTGIGAKNLSALPLLCFAKAYNDYMSHSSRFNTSFLTKILLGVKEEASNQTFYTPSTHTLTYSGILDILSGISLIYENDYFISAWQSPNAPIGSVQSQSSFVVPGTPTPLHSAQSLSNSDNGTSLINFASSNFSTLYQRSLDFLKSFDDWVRRNNYSGSRDVQQVYSRFGIKTDEYRSQFAHVLSTDITPIQVGDVTSQAQSDGVVLGDYAGKGIVNGGDGFNFVSNDYGMLIVFGWIAVKPMNAFGFSRSVLKSDPLDYYNPEFDGLGANAISYGELFTNPIANSSDTTTDDQVYGFTERYNEYRFGRDMITGDFRNYHKDADMNTWHTGRLLNTIRQNNNMIAQGNSMVQVSKQNSEFNRIFSVTDDSVDHFYMVANFDVFAVRPMLNLNQVPDLGEGDTAVPRNGNQIN